MVVTAHQQQRAIVGVVEQGQHLADFLGSLRPAEFCRSVPGSTDRVRDVTAHLIVVQNHLLEAIERPTAERPHPLADFLVGLRVSHHHLEELAGELAEHQPGPELATHFQASMDDIMLRLRSPELPGVVSTPAPLQLVDLLRMVSTEWVLRSDDLTRAIPGHRPIQWHRSVLADAVRTLAEALRRHHPGQAVEIRVPPFAAVQCGGADGPRHTRGTPPAVVECEPIHFVRLCRGRETFAEALRYGHVHASGVRADISDWLPLY